MRHRDVIAVDRIGGAGAHRIRSKMRHELVAVQIEIDPVTGASPLRAAEQVAVESPRRGKVVDRDCEMEWRQAHACRLPPAASHRNDAGA